MDTTKLIAVGLAFALVGFSAPAVASGPGGHGGQDGGFGGLPDQALFGICKAFGHADENATAIAKPFQWLTSGMCDDAEHPAEDRRPERAGPPA